MWRGFGMIDGLNRLRHHSVICGDDEHDDVGDVCAARTHRSESRVTRRVDECDSVSFVINGVSADVLSNAAGFASGDSGFANRIHQ